MKKRTTARFALGTCLMLSLGGLFATSVQASPVKYNVGAPFQGAPADGLSVRAHGERSTDGGFGALTDGGSVARVAASLTPVAASATAHAPAEPIDSPTWRPGQRGYSRPADPVNPQTNPCTGRDLLYLSHVDSPYATFDAAGQLAVKTVDGSDVRDNSEVCIRLGADAVNGVEVSRLVVPDDPRWRFLGLPGALVWHAPLTYQGEHSVWVGLGAFDNAHEWHQPAGIDLKQVTLRLVKAVTPTGRVLSPESHAGNEQLNIFTVRPDGSARELVSTNQGLFSLKLEQGVHTHAGWTFSAPGYWKLYWQAEISVNGKIQTSSPTEQIWAVGTLTDVSLKGNGDGTEPGMSRIVKSAEMVREERGLRAPVGDWGFDYPGTKTASEQEKLPAASEVPQPEPAPVGRSIDRAAFASNLEKRFDSSRKDWDDLWKRRELHARELRLWAWPWQGSASDDWRKLLRTSIFTERADAKEIASTLAVDPVDDPEDDFGQAPDSPNSFKRGESIVALTDDTLQALPSGFLSSLPAFEQFTGEPYAYVWGEPTSRTFTIETPNEPGGKVKSYGVFISADPPNSSIPGDSRGVVLAGKINQNPANGALKFEPLLNSLDSAERKLALKPGDKLPLTLLFGRPGLVKLNLTVQAYCDDESDCYTPSQQSYYFVVGNEAINAMRSYQQKHLLAEGDETCTDPDNVPFGNEKGLCALINPVTLLPVGARPADASAAGDEVVRDAVDPLRLWNARYEWLRKRHEEYLASQPTSEPQTDDNVPIEDADIPSQPVPASRPKPAREPASRPSSASRPVPAPRQGSASQHRASSQPRSAAAKPTAARTTFAKPVATAAAGPGYGLPADIVGGLEYGPTTSLGSGSSVHPDSSASRPADAPAPADAPTPAHAPAHVPAAAHPVDSLAWGLLAVGVIAALAGIGMLGYVMGRKHAEGRKA